MRNLQGKRIEYPGCVEVVNGVFISDEGEVYIHDTEGEVCCWVHDELVEDPQAATAAFTAIALAAKMGAKAVRNNLVDRGTTLGVLVKHTARISESLK